MAVVMKVFDVLTRKLQKLQFNPDVMPEVDESSSFSSSEYFLDDAESKNMQKIDVPPAQTADMDLLEKKIKRLLAKLKKHNLYLHVFEHSDIHYGPTLGKGGEGIVQKCTVTYNDLPVDAAVKTVLNNSDDALDLTFHEIELLCLARDPIMTTTLQVFGVAAVPDRDNPNKGHLVIITEAGIKNLLQLYQDETIPLHVTYDLWHSISVAMHCLHKKNIIHQDLKPENVLVTGVSRDSYGTLEKVVVKIIDLGMARLVEGSKIVSEDIVGTTGYHSPEVLFDDSYGIHADIFVLGITFCVMLLPQTVLCTKALQALLKRIDEAKARGLVGQSLFLSVIQPTLDKDTSISTAIFNMLCKMLERVEKRNISLLEIAAVCQQEAIKVRQLPSHSHNSRSRGTNQDSGIDSSDGNFKHKSDDGKDLKAKTKSHAAETSPKKAPQRQRAKRKNARTNPYIKKTTTAAKVEATKKPPANEEPVCRRTRNGVKRSHGSTVEEPPKKKKRNARS